MSIVLPDGYVLDTIGPFASNGSNNDVAMTAEILRQVELGVDQWIKKGEQNIIVDRGFRNVVEYLRGLGAQVYMPTVTTKKQDNVSEANNSRLVTKVRWVVTGTLSTRSCKTRSLWGPTKSSKPHTTPTSTSTLRATSPFTFTGRRLTSYGRDFSPAIKTQPSISLGLSSHRKHQGDSVSHDLVSTHPKISHSRIERTSTSTVRYHHQFRGNFEKPGAGLPPIPDTIHDWNISKFPPR